MLDFFKNLFVGNGLYKAHSEAVIVSCFFNPENSPYRLIAFQKFYQSIKHLNHLIVECLIGDTKPQLPGSPHIKVIRTESLLWHKESLLNHAITLLDDRFKYVFWVDADVLFTNKSWMTDAVKVLKTKNIVQPFEYCFHLDQNQTEPDQVSENNRWHANSKAFKIGPSKFDRKVWRGFCANYVTTNYSESQDYNQHGHVGFAWGARREVLDKILLYDKALIGGADHIMAHAAAGHIPHMCIRKSFTDDIENVERWSRSFHSIVQGKIGYVSGDLYHLWHGDTSKREYLKRIQDFTQSTKHIITRDVNGLFVSHDPEHYDYVKKYFSRREVGPQGLRDIPRDYYEDFYETMGYSLFDLLEDAIILSVMLGSDEPAQQEELFVEIEPEVFS